jgi:hypothetical protein
MILLRATALTQNNRAKTSKSARGWTCRGPPGENILLSVIRLFETETFEIEERIWRIC